jgi:two-component sensor histidine kinase
MFKAFSQNKRRFFWFLQTSGWLAYAFMNFFQGRTFGATPDYFYTSMLYGLAGFILTLGLRYIYKSIWDIRPALLFFLAIVAMIVVTALFDASKTWIYFQFEFVYQYATEDLKPQTWLDYITTFPLSFYLILAWSGLYFGIKYYRLLQIQNEAVLKATNAAHQSQLKMLRYQLNPHFLFNTLNAISTLVLEGDTQTANQMVTQLSAFLRHSLDRDPVQKISLKKELEAMNLYLSIEKIRFDDRLHVQIEVSPEASTALVPSLILQPLIENSIKYAIAAAEDGGTIAIKAERKGDLLCMQVVDDGPGVADLENIKPSDGGGVGLVNTRERLLVLYGTQQQFQVSNRQPQGLTVKICIPFERSST